MRQLLAVIALVAFGWLAFSSARADAVPACLPRNERLGLQPRAVTYNGQTGTPIAAGSGLYSTDAGVQFYVGATGELGAGPSPGSTACPAPADEVTLTVTDPWTGEQRTFAVRGTP